MRTHTATTTKSAKPAAARKTRGGQPTRIVKTSLTAAPSSAPVAVTLDNFARAETDMYFARTVESNRIGRLVHSREMADVANQTIVRMNRDTIYSSGVFDLDASPVTITLPDTGKRFMSMQIVNEDHYTLAVVYGPGTFTYTRDQAGTRYLFTIIRTLANPADTADMKLAHAAQDGISVAQEKKGIFRIPHWDTDSQDKVRDALNALAPLGRSGERFGTKGQVDPLAHLVATAAGWGGNPSYAAVYEIAFPKQNDGKTAHRLTVKDVPVDGFWSISVYNAKGFFEKNPQGAYSLNNLTAKPEADGSYVVQFGGGKGRAANCLPIVKGWNYAVRLYRPRKEILEGKWTFPEARPVNSA
jgi:para-nitrobenzyl esterase